MHDKTAARREKGKALHESYTLSVCKWPLSALGHLRARGFHKLRAQLVGTTNALRRFPHRDTVGWPLLVQHRPTCATQPCQPINVYGRSVSLSAAIGV